jgi:hypothetical protein
MIQTSAHTTPRADVLTLGDTRFGVLVGGPFDGRCYPLPNGDIPVVLDVPGPGPGPSPALRYELHEGLYRYRSAQRSAA